MALTSFLSARKAAILAFGLGVVLTAGATRAGDPADEPVVRPGKASVKAIQQQLMRDGYAPGRVTGRMDSRTRAAVRRFQDDCGLPADASGGGTLAEKLNNPGRCPNGGVR